MRKDEELKLFYQERYSNTRRELSDMRAVADYLFFYRCTPHILREFINRHWNEAVSSEEWFIRQLCSDVVETLKTLSAREYEEAMGALNAGKSPSLVTLRKVCKILGWGYGNGVSK